MPYLPKTTKRPWIPERKPFEGANKSVDYNSKQWRKLRAAKRATDPLCEICKAEGRTTPAECVDHIIPTKQGGDPWAWDNLQSLCRPCHYKKTGSQNKRSTQEQP